MCTQSKIARHHSKLIVPSIRLHFPFRGKTSLREMADVKVQVNNPKKVKSKKGKASQSKPQQKFMTVEVGKKTAKRALQQKNLDQGQTNAIMESQITGIIKSIAAPKDFDVPRLGSVYASYPTGVAKLYQRQPSFFADLNSAGTFDSSTGFAFREPYCSFITPVNCNIGYSYVSPPTSVTGDVNGATIQFPFLMHDSNPLYPNRVHGDALFPGRIPNSNDNYFYASPGSSLSVTNNSNSAGATIRIFRWWNDSRGQVSEQSLPALGYINYSVTLPGYYSFKAVVASGFAPYNVGLSIFQATLSPSPLVYIWGHFCMPSIYANSSNVNAVKTIGVGLCYTNDASPLNKQGKIAGIQLAAGSIWSNYTNYSAIASLSDCVSMPAENGIYGFLKPTQPRDMDFMAFETVTGNSLATDAYWNIIPNSDFLCVSALVTTAAGQDGYWTPQYAIEYRTESQFVEVRSPVISPSVVDTAMMWISKLPQWHENPFHISDIFDWIGDRVSDVYNGVKNALPKIIDTAATVVKYGAPIAAALL
jgi:hypothetical protein